MKECKDNTNRWRDISCVLGLEESMLWNDYTTQINLQIHCNPYQNSNGIFHRTRTKNCTICMETQKTLNSQSNLEKENWPGGINLSDFRLYYILYYTVLTKDNMVLAQRQKYTPTEQVRKPRDKPMHIWTPCLWQRAGMYNGRKTASSASGAGETGELNVK